MLSAMVGWILDHEPAVRLGTFLAVLACVGVIETIRPRRGPTRSKGLRWANNLGLSVVNTVILRLMTPATLVGAAAWADFRGYGLFNRVVLPGPVEIVLSVLMLDLVIYGQHVAFHKVPALWRIHRMHHTDVDIDASTGVRFHPVEMALSLGLKLGAVVAFGVGPIAAFLFEVILNGVTLFNHGNLRLGPGVDAAIRAVIVTPDMHRIHHSADRAETDSNYGFNLSWWDKLFGTYRAAPALGYDGMVIGLDEFRDPKWLGLAWMLVTPFYRTSSKSRGRRRITS
jgi:sterol desaturase/sphingolipid hydroxylase (fatty acid hydroxylase superfamily)